MADFLWENNREILREKMSFSLNNGDAVNKEVDF